ncbi:MAG: phosphoglucosamine mutase [Actinobacteria bacterium]|nr:phosphoglucosamine mutase [Actinomycetota bacterium]
MKDLRQLFGTDGIRGVANIDLTPEFAVKVGRAGARYLADKSKKSSIIIGRDPRPSGDFISSALISGILSSGIDVLDAGIITTPAVALITRLLGADGGIVISASHNPINDNGIKFFAKGGHKLTDLQEKSIEDFILNSTAESNGKKLSPSGSGPGRYKKLGNANEIYINYLSSNFKLDLSGLKIALDCANGAASILAPAALEKFGAKVISFNNDTGGELINKNCGSTHPDVITGLILESRADIGFTYDGDGDRVIAADNQGRILDGDIIIGFCAIDMLKKGLLKNNSVVTTVMANIGFDKVLNSKGIKIYKTNVGDRYVLEKMIEVDSILGGEQSGHIIFRNLSPTGDGIISTLEFLNVVINNNYDLEKIHDLIPKYPQVLKNVNVKDKSKILSNENLKSIIKSFEDSLGNSGRILVRPSGTEPLIRVMVEAETVEKAEEIVSSISDEINNIDRAI